MTKENNKLSSLNSNTNNTNLNISSKVDEFPEQSPGQSNINKSSELLEHKHTQRSRRYRRSDDNALIKSQNFVTREALSILKDKNRDADKEEKKNALLNAVHSLEGDKFEIGAAVDNGDCFFDSIAQALNKADILRKDGNKHTVQSLRQDCKSYANNNRAPQKWVYDKVTGDADDYFVPLENPDVDVVKENNGNNKKMDKPKTFCEYLEKITDIAVDTKIPIWGRLNIEGKMICEEYGVQIKVIVIEEKKVGESYITESEEGKGGRNTIHMVNYKQHFVPLLSGLEGDIKEKIQVPIKEVYDIDIVKQATRPSNQQQDEERLISEIHKFDTVGDGNCFFHAVFGSKNSNSEYQVANAASMRQEWYNFLKQFHSHGLKDPNMPLALKDQLNKVFQIFLDNPNELINRSDKIKLLAEQTKSNMEKVETEVNRLKDDIIQKFQSDKEFRENIYKTVSQARKGEGKSAPSISELLNDETKLGNEILNALEAFALGFDQNLNHETYSSQYNSQVVADSFLENTEVYRNYLEAIKESSYYIFFEEIPILASLANTKIEVHYYDNGRRETQVFNPNPELRGNYPLKPEIWGNREKAIISNEGMHFSYSELVTTAQNSNKNEQILNQQKKLDFSEREKIAELAYKEKRNESINDKDSTPLFIAVKNGDMQRVKDLLNDANVKERDSNGRTILHIAAINGNNEIARLIITTNIVIASNTVFLLQAKDYNKDTALHLAAENGRDVIVRLLAARGQNVNEKNLQGNTPLNLATMKNHNIIDALLDSMTTAHAFNVAAENDIGDTALHIAVKKHNVEITRSLLQNGFLDTRNEAGFTALDIGTINGNNEIVKLLLQNMVSLDSVFNRSSRKGNTPLHLAAKYGNWKVIEAILDNDVRIMGFDSTPEELTNYINSGGNTPLHLAAKYEQLKAVETLVRYEADANIQNGKFFEDEHNTPLHIAVKKNNKDIVDALLKAENIDIDILDGNQDTALHLAAINNAVDIIKKLVIHTPISLGIRAEELDTVLTSAIKFDAIDAAITLIDLRYEYVDFNQVDRFSLDYEDSIKRREVGEADIINTSDINGDTPLILATQRYHSGEKDMDRVITKLIQVGVDISLRNNDDNTVRSYDNSHLIDDIYTCIEKFDTNRDLVLHEVITHIESDLGSSNADDSRRNEIIEYNIRLLRIFLFLDSNLNLKNSEGMTPLFRLSRIIKSKEDIDRKILDAVKLLITYGADVNAECVVHEDEIFSKNFMAQNPGSIVIMETPLHAAVNAMRWDIVQELIDNKADINALTSLRETPMHVASRVGGYEIMLSILKHAGVQYKKDLLNSQGETALKLSEEVKQMNPKAASLEYIDFGRDHNNKQNNSNKQLKLDNRRSHAIYIVQNNVQSQNLIDIFDSYRDGVNVRGERRSLVLIIGNNRNGFEVFVISREFKTYYVGSMNSEVYKEVKGHLIRSLGVTENNIYNKDKNNNSIMDVVRDTEKIVIALKDGKPVDDVLNDLTEKQLSTSRKRPSIEASELLQEIKKIRLSTDSDECGSRRRKRHLGCVRESDDIIPYEPLKIDDAEMVNAKPNLHLQIAIAIAWKNNEQLDDISKIVKYNRNIGDIINEGESNHSSREEELIRNHYTNSERFFSSYKKLHLLKEDVFQTNSGRQSWIFDDGSHSLLVLKDGNNYKLYGQDFNYRHILKTKQEITVTEVEKFIRAFFNILGNKKYKVYILADSLPEGIIYYLKSDNIRKPDGVMSDHMLLEKEHGGLIEGVSKTVVRELFFLDGKAPRIESLGSNFFNENKYKGKISFRANRLHEALPSLTENNIRTLESIVKNHDFPADKSFLEKVPKSERDLLLFYNDKVMEKLKLQQTITLNDLSKLSYEALRNELEVGKHEDINYKDKISVEERGKIVESFKDLHSRVSSHLQSSPIGTVLKSAAQQGLFLLPDIIKSANTGNYEELLRTGAMITGDMTLNKGYEKLIGVLGKIKPNMAEVLSKLPITSPIFKGVVIYSIFDLNSKLKDPNLSPEDRDSIKHALDEQYATASIMLIEMFGVETGPLWVALTVEQLLWGVHEFQKRYHIDAPFGELLWMSLGGEQDKLEEILEERQLANMTLQLIDKFFRSVGTAYKHFIVSVPTITPIYIEVSYNEVPDNIKNNTHTTLAGKKFSFMEVFNKVEAILNILPSSNVIYESGNFKLLEYMKQSKVIHQWFKKNYEVQPTNIRIEFTDPPGLSVHQDRNIFFSTSNYTVKASEELDQAQSCNIQEGCFYNNPIRIKGRAAVYKNITTIEAPCSPPSPDCRKLVYPGSQEDYNRISYIYDYREGNTTLVFTKEGLNRFDVLNEDVNKNYTSDPASLYTIDIVLTYKFDASSMVFPIPSFMAHTEFKLYGRNYSRIAPCGKFKLRDESSRVVSRYIITDDSIDGWIEDRNTSQSSVTFSIMNSNCTINSTASYSSTIINLWRNDDSPQQILTNTITFSQESISKRKKALSINMGKCFIGNKLSLTGINNLLINNAQGYDNDGSISLSSTIGNFYITSLKNIKVENYLTSLYVSDNTFSNITYSKSGTNMQEKQVDHYNLRGVDYMEQVLNGMYIIPKSFKFLYKLYFSNNETSFEFERKDKILMERKLIFNVQGSFGDGNKIGVWKIYDDTSSSFIIKENKGNVIKTILLHRKKQNKLDLNFLVLDGVIMRSNSNNTIEDTVVVGNNSIDYEIYYNSEHYPKGYVLVFSKLFSNSSIYHIFPTATRNSFNVNGINYAVKGNNFYAIANPGKVIDGDKLIWENSKLDTKKIGIWFKGGADNVHENISTRNGSFSINNTTLVNLPDDTLISFGEGGAFPIILFNKLVKVEVSTASVTTSVQLPMNFTDIKSITGSDGQKFSYSGNNESFGISKLALVNTTDGLLIFPAENNTIQLTKITNKPIVPDEINELRNISNSNLKISMKRLFTSDASAIISNSNNTFHAKKENHNYYWETAFGVANNLYLFSSKNYTNVIIVNAFGILDFTALNISNITFKNEDYRLFFNKDNFSLILDNPYENLKVKYIDDEHYEVKQTKNLKNQVKTSYLTANELHAIDQELSKLNPIIVNGLKYLWIIAGDVNEFSMYECFGFGSLKDQDKFKEEMRTRNISTNDLVKKILPCSEVSETTVWLIVKSYSNFFLTKNVHCSGELSKSVSQCFGKVIDSRIVRRLIRNLENNDDNNSITYKVERFIRHHQQELQDNIRNNTLHLLRIDGQEVHETTLDCTNLTYVELSTQISNETQPSSSVLHVRQKRYIKVPYYKIYEIIPLYQKIALLSAKDDMQVNNQNNTEEERGIILRWQNDDLINKQDFVSSSASRPGFWLAELARGIKSVVMDTAKYLDPNSFGDITQSLPVLDSSISLKAQSNMFINTAHHDIPRLSTHTKYDNDHENFPSPSTKDQKLNCVPYAWDADSQKYATNVMSCISPSGQVKVFSNIHQETSFVQTKSYSISGDSYRDCRPVEFYGRPSVYCEGEQTNMVYTPDIQYRLFNNLDSNLMLGSVIWHQVRKLYQWYTQPATMKEDEPIVEITFQQLHNWQILVNNIEELLTYLASRLGNNKLQWANNILKDRLREIYKLSELSTANMETVTELTENLKVLHNDLKDFKEELLLSQKQCSAESSMFSKSTQDKSTSVNKDDYSAIILAIKDNDIVQVENYLREGKDVNACSKGGMTLLMRAVTVAVDVGQGVEAYKNDKKYDIIKLLIEYGADVNAETNEGETAINFASSNGDLESIQILVSNEARIKNKTEKNSPFSCVAESSLDKNTKDTVKELLTDLIDGRIRAYYDSDVSLTNLTQAMSGFSSVDSTGYYDRTHTSYINASQYHLFPSHNLTQS